jgi:hypothetical protein
VHTSFCALWQGGPLERVTFAAADTRSFERATIVLNKVGDATVAAMASKW